jgi:hypothetical protein
MLRTPLHGAFFRVWQYLDSPWPALAKTIEILYPIQGMGSAARFRADKSEMTEKKGEICENAEIKIMVKFS